MERGRPMTLRIAQDEAADEVLSTNAFALVAGMLLDQQFPMERAFAGPAKVLDRFGTLDPVAIAEAPPEEFAAMCAVPPAVHRFPGSMAGRIQELARHVVDEYDGDVSRMWDEAQSGADLLRRVQGLPGFGKQKSQIFVALLGKQLGITPLGWEMAAGVYAEEGSYRSVADVRDPASLEKVRAFKKEQKAKAKPQAG
jgi:uncharacterized HhH-GPD family protein